MSKEDDLKTAMRLMDVMKLTRQEIQFLLKCITLDMKARGEGDIGYSKRTSILHLQGKLSIQLQNAPENPLWDEDAGLS